MQQTTGYEDKALLIDEPYGKYDGRVDALTKKRPHNMRAARVKRLDEEYDSADNLMK